MLRSRHVVWIPLATSFAILAVAVAFSLFFGSAGLSSAQILKVFIPGSPLDERAWTIVMSVRLPRILFAVLSGGALAVSGAVFQVLLRNDLADPYILGVSSGAALGAVIAFTTGLAALHFFAVPLAAFSGSLLSIIILYGFSRRGQLRAENALLLCGVMIGAFFSAIVLGLLSVSPSHAHSALFWIIGYLGDVSMRDIMIVGPLVFVLVICIQFLSSPMNALSLGTDAASMLGVGVRRLSRSLLLLSSLLTAIVVSYSGTIGFIGLIIPHIIRRTVGIDNRLLIPMSFIIGAAFLVICDFLSRVVFFPGEAPVGAMTAFFGAPIFLFLLHYRSR
jgi:iron complex transport system permease protein